MEAAQAGGVDQPLAVEKQVGIGPEGDLSQVDAFAVAQARRAAKPDHVVDGALHRARARPSFGSGDLGRGDTIGARAVWAWRDVFAEGIAEDDRCPRVGRVGDRAEEPVEQVHGFRGGVRESADGGHRLLEGLPTIVPGIMAGGKAWQFSVIDGGLMPESVTGKSSDTGKMPQNPRESGCRFIAA